MSKQNRKKIRLKNKKYRENIQFEHKKVRERIRLNENLQVAQNALTVSCTLMLLAVKDEKGLSKEMSRKVMKRFNSLLMEFNIGDEKIQDLKELVKEELDLTILFD